MKRGPKPAPTVLKIARGTRKDRIPQAEPPKIERDPEPPPHLDPIALAEWQRILPLFRESKVISETDGTALAVYCVAYSRWVGAEKLIVERGMIGVNPSTGGPIVQPWVNLANQMMAQMQRSLIEFGATPSSRTRVSGAKPAESADELESFLKRKPRKIS